MKIHSSLVAVYNTLEPWFSGQHEYVGNFPDNGKINHLCVYVVYIPVTHVYVGVGGIGKYVPCYGIQNENIAV